MRSSSWNYSQFRLLSISIAFIFDPSKLRPKRVASTFRLSSLDLKIAPFLSNRAISQTNKLFKTKPIEHQSSIPASSAKLFATFSLIYKKFLSNRPVCSISSFVFKLHCKSPFQAFFHCKSPSFDQPKFWVSNAKCMFKCIKGGNYQNEDYQCSFVSFKFSSFSTVDSVELRVTSTHFDWVALTQTNRTQRAKSKIKLRREIKRKRTYI